MRMFAFHEIHAPMRTLKFIRQLLWEHPLFWLVLVLRSLYTFSALPLNSWNVEMLIARNILDGFGFVDTPLDPPALWRPPLAVGVLIPIERFLKDPEVVYSIFCTLTMVGFLVAVFYLMKFIGGNVAAHFSQLVLLTIPAFTGPVGHQLQLLSYILVFSVGTLAVFLTLRSWQRASWNAGSACRSLLGNHVSGAPGSHSLVRGQSAGRIDFL